MISYGNANGYILTELIGEEIYDEFDVEGTGAHSEMFVPPGAHPHQQTKKPGLVRKISAPELAGDKGNMGEPPSMPPTTNRNALGLAMPKPIALTSLKSLGFLRSRSAPPTPRDQTKPLPGSAGATPPGAATPVPVPAPVPHVAGSKSEDNSTSAARKSGDLGPYGSGIYPPVILSNPEGDMHQLTQIAESPSPGDEAPSSNAGGTVAASSQEKHATDSQSKTPSPAPGYPFPNPGVAAAAMPKSRSASPSPLEAILHSKRRAPGGGGTPRLTTGDIGPASGPTTPMDQRGRAKGVFKSSPLAPLGADANAVVAEEIKKQKVQEAKDREAAASSTTKGEE